MFQTQITHWLHLYLHVFQLEGFQRVPLQILQKSCRLNQVSTRLETKHSDAFQVLTVPSTSKLKGLAQNLDLDSINRHIYLFFFFFMHQSFWLAVVGLMSPDLLIVHFLISRAFLRTRRSFGLTCILSRTICLKLAGNPTPEAFWLSEAGLLPFAVRNVARTEEFTFQSAAARDSLRARA